MRLHLIISRHGLPITRILWTTTSATSALGEYGVHRAASASAIAASRTPNIAFANGGYTIAQLLEDVNEVVPLETEPSMFDPEYSGQWGLEDYVVEVGGSECLHFMEVDGILRDGDEVMYVWIPLERGGSNSRARFQDATLTILLTLHAVSRIRALQLSDLRARRICGRHQITAEGKHLVDGVPFGSPFLKRTTSARPGVSIPPRKKRRTIFSGWDQTLDYPPADPNADEEGDGDWVPPGDAGFGKELSILPAEHEESDLGTVIRHPIDHDAETDSDAAEFEPEEDELESELQALKEDFEEPASQFIDIRRTASGPTLRSTSTAKRPSSADTLRRGSLVGASSLSSKRSRGDETSPRTSKAVRFNKGDEDMPDLPESDESAVETPSTSKTPKSPKSSSPSSTDSSDASSEDDSSEEDESSDSSSDSDDSSEESSSESEEEEVSLRSQKKRSIMNPPGQGSVRTRKSNNRYKLRRRLSKLKELGALPAEADFAALRSWENSNGGWYIPEESSFVVSAPSKTYKKEQEQREFEAKRQKLLRDLASGGVDVDETSEKENVPPHQAAAMEAAFSEEAADADKYNNELANRRTLDIASSRRMLFGSLGMRTPRTKEDEDETRRKFAAQASTVQPRKKTVDTQPVEEDSESDVDWENKLVIRATECVFDDIELSAPPFPFEQRWDSDADAIIRQRKGWGKKRKRKQRAQVYYGNEEEQDEYEDGNGGYDDGDIQLNYDDPEPETNKAPTAEDHKATATDVPDDLPALPSDLDSVPDLTDSDAKVGAIIAFRQLDMSKATNWQPQMSEYRVAEIHAILDHGMLNVRLAQRHRKPKDDAVDPDDDEPRQYSGFEMPGLEDDEEEDDGYRDLTFAELSDPKLLRPAPGPVDAEMAGGDNTEEGSIVSVIQDFMPNGQLAAPPADMDLDETTFITVVTDDNQLQTPRESFARASNTASPQQTPGGVRLPQTQAQNGHDERSGIFTVPSPSFSGFHSARSVAHDSPEPQVEDEIEESNFEGRTLDGNNLDGHTLIGELQSGLADNSNQDFSALSFASVNQSGVELSPEHQQHDRRVVDDQPAPFADSAEDVSRPDSLLSPIQRPEVSGSGMSPSARGVEKSPSVEGSSVQAPDSWENILDMLKNGPVGGDDQEGDEDEEDDEDYEREEDDNEDESEDEEDEDNEDEDKEEDQDKDQDQDDYNMDHNLDLGSSRESSQASHSGQPPRSGQAEPQSQKSAAMETESPPASTRLKRSLRSRDLGSASQPNASQTSEVVDLTASPEASSHPAHTNPEPEQSQSSGESGWVSKPGADQDTLPRSSGRQTRASSGKVQRMTEVSISPQTQRKKPWSRKF
ncbi:hypothetical protein NUU61_005669 [Penicillium alfredii]|uniref:Uncharacterized protein n=1 Tax=Penicillium alfredii TaxID=1506179 RepID=A0A9W9K7W8_9EURO|nr:uncharacterized protein NUU61_005669 [Penicillium alfredii]KAJ5096313.1 hypothetical protein NUU61_005669 [Penicillium alfredii]